jgi:hypothetical protein
MAHVAASIAKGTHDPVEYTTVTKPVRDPSITDQWITKGENPSCWSDGWKPDAEMDAMLSNPN